MFPLLVVILWNLHVPSTPGWLCVCIYIYIITVFPIQLIYWGHLVPLLSHHDSHYIYIYHKWDSYGIPYHHYTIYTIPHESRLVGWDALHAFPPPCSGTAGYAGGEAPAICVAAKNIGTYRGGHGEIHEEWRFSSENVGKTLMNGRFNMI